MPTREGTVIFVLAAAVFFLATNLMSGLMFALDAVLVALILVGVATAYAPLRGVKISRRVPARTTEGRATPIESTLVPARTGRLLTLEEGWKGTRARAIVPRLHPGAPVTVTLGLIPPRRGQFTLEPTEVTSRGAVGLFVARRTLAARERITVWPQVQPIPPQTLVRLVPASEGSAQGLRTRHPDDLYGMRDYQRGDSPARVHWPSSVRRGTLVVREYERPTVTSTVIVVDVDRRQSPDRLDAVVRAAASVLRAALDRRADIVVAAYTGAYVETRGWEATMDWLSGLAPSGPPLAEALAAMPGREGRGLIVVASSAAVPPLPEGAVAILPADDRPSGGLVYAQNGVVHAW